MTSKNDIKFAFRLAIILLVVSAVCYAAIPEKKPDIPVRIQLSKKMGGKVLFTHKKHTDASGYGAVCTDCHHHYEEEGATFRSCDDCHLKEITSKVPDACLECHSPGEEHHGSKDTSELTCNDCHKLSGDESVPKVCGDCHDPDEVAGQVKIIDLQNKTDAYHGQCADCHKEYGSGPIYDKNDNKTCSKCHETKS